MGTVCTMTREEMVAAIEGEIMRLEQVRELLRSSTSQRFNAAEAPTSSVRKPRVLSAEARKRIAQAQKKRWAKQRKANAGSPVAEA